MCLKNYALHKQKNPFLPAFDSPVRPKSSEYSIPPAEAEIILVGTVPQFAFTFNPPTLPQFLAQTRKHLPTLLTEP